MTLEVHNSLTQQEQELDENGFWKAASAAYLAERERVRLHYAQVSLRSPLYRARAAKDPQFLSNYSAGAVR